MLRQRKLYKRKKRNRYLTIRRLKPVTVCIAAICDMIKGYFPKIVLCADRLVTSGIQFEGGESKIRKITDYCYSMVSSSNSVVSDLILENVKEKAIVKEDPPRTRDIVEILRQECITFKRECIERDVLFNYNVISEKLGMNPELVIKEAKEEVDSWEYPLECEFILAGLDTSKEAHIYRIDQDGNYCLDDYLGFSTIGSGGSLVFLEMTKYGYSRSVNSVIAIPRVYISKKISERAEGVGRYTDLGVLCFPTSTQNGNKPLFLDLSHPDFLPKWIRPMMLYKKMKRGKWKNYSKMFTLYLVGKNQKAN